MCADRSRLRVLAFEPFDAGSHRAVRESISRWSRHEWMWITRPGRNWKWRMRLAAIEMVDAARSRGVLDAHVDAVFATSLMSAADLRAMLPARLRAVPLVLYMHENQAAYPAGHETPGAGGRDVHFALTNLASVLAADCVMWNSAWNLRSFVDGIEVVLRAGSDAAVGDVRAVVEGKSVVIWPPVEAPERDAKTRAAAVAGPVRVVWPHRWEHDKGPDELLSLAERYTQQCNLRWTILGERYRRVPSEIAEFERRFSDSIDHIGFIADREEYWRALASCDWVLSTSRHEFFGIAVVEALLAGCLPWLPARLSYVELLPDEAVGLSPMSPPANAPAVREAIATHLAPATAHHAVSKMDRVMEDAVSAASPLARRDTSQYQNRRSPHDER
jgi:glycosyltransferase involved in cell wall biosynthesis